MRISDWSSDVCSSDLARQPLPAADAAAAVPALEIVCVVLLGHGHTIQRQIQRPRPCAACLLWRAVKSVSYLRRIGVLLVKFLLMICSLRGNRHGSLPPEKPMD